MLARICTENKDYGGLLRLINRLCRNFTVIKTEMILNSIPKHSLIIEIDMDESGFNTQDIEHIAFDIKKHNKQQVILVRYIEHKTKSI